MKQPIIILAGAGMSADCGLPTFRDSNGYWKNKIRYQDIANPYSFRSNPDLGWQFYDARRQAYSKANPHDGYRAIADLARTKNIFVLTTNVDGLFHKASIANVVELHGSIQQNQCQDVCSRKIWPASAGDHCPQCGIIGRPNICMFHDPFWIDDPYRQQEAVFNHWLVNLKQKPIIIEVGAGKAIPRLRIMGKQLAERFGVEVHRINKEENELTAAADLPDFLEPQSSTN